MHYYFHIGCVFFFFFFSFSWLCFSHVVILCCYFCINITTFSQKCENTTTWTTWLTTNPSHIGVATFMRWCYCLPTLMAMLLSHVGVGGAFLHWWCCLPTLALLFVYIGGVAFPWWCCCIVTLVLLFFTCFATTLLTLVMFFSCWCYCYFHVDA